MDDRTVRRLCIAVSRLTYCFESDCKGDADEERRFVDALGAMLARRTPLRYYSTVPDHVDLHHQTRSMRKIFEARLGGEATRTALVDRLVSGIAWGWVTHEDIYSVIRQLAAA